MRKSLSLSLSESALEFLSGELLGDGYLDHRIKRASTYQHTSKHKEYVEWLSKKLGCYGIEQCGRILEYETRYGICFYYMSRYYTELRALQSKWYIDVVEENHLQCRKRLPMDLELTPLTCRQWYIGDGYLSKRDRGITLNTQCFKKKEVDFLVSLLRALKLKARRHANGVIRIWTQSVSDFLDFIGPCPEDIMSIYGYKWRVRP